MRNKKAKNNNLTLCAYELKQWIVIEIIMMMQHMHVCGAYIYKAI